MIRSRKTRSGFTLVELMISAAITVLIMTILSICFQTSMKAMSAMRAQGDAADQLRAVGEVIKRDVSASHFLPVDPGTGPRNLGRRLSDYDPLANPTVSPRSGFFYLDSPPPISEGTDGVFESTRSTPIPGVHNGARLWMTSVLAGGSEGNLFTTTVFTPQPTTVSSEAAEIAYFLSPMPGEFTATQGQRYNLHRRQRLVAIDGNKRQTLDGLGSPDRISRNRLSPAFANTIDSLVLSGGRELPGTASILTPLGTGDDIILSNVISFEIKPTWRHSNVARNPRSFVPNVITDTPFDNLTVATGGAGFTFDTLDPARPPIRINAVQLRIRIYDPKAKTARQSTFVLDL